MIDIERARREWRQRNPKDRYSEQDVEKDDYIRMIRKYYPLVTDSPSVFTKEFDLEKYDTGWIGELFNAMQKASFQNLDKVDVGLFNKTLQDFKENVAMISKDAYTGHADSEKQRTAVLDRIMSYYGPYTEYTGQHLSPDHIDPNELQKELKTLNIDILRETAETLRIEKMRIHDMNEDLYFPILQNSIRMHDDELIQTTANKENCSVDEVCNAIPQLCTSKGLIKMFDRFMENSEYDEKSLHRVAYEIGQNPANTDNVKWHMYDTRIIAKMIHDTPNIDVPTICHKSESLTTPQGLEQLFDKFIEKRGYQLEEIQTVISAIQRNPECTGHTTAYMKEALLKELISDRNQIRSEQEKIPDVPQKNKDTNEREH